MKSRSLFLCAALIALATSCGGAINAAGPAIAVPVANPEAAPRGAERVASADALVVEEGGTIPVSASDPTWGSRAALVTIVTFSDFQCPFCSRAEGTLAQLRDRYGQEQLRIVWKNYPLPFHAQATPAATAAAAVFLLGGPQAFWRFHHEVFSHQQEMNEERYRDWAKLAGVEPSGLERLSVSASQKVKDDAALGEQLGVQGTPHFFVNGVVVNGAQPFDRFVEVIDAELAKAKAKVAAGTPRERVHQAMVAENFQNAKPQQPDKANAPAIDTTYWNVPLGKSPVRGNADALVTVVVFSDFQCPFCKRVEPTIEQVRQQYGGKVRVVWKNNPLPFHPRALPAAELALEARAQKGEKAFWDAHDRLFDSQQHLDDADLETIAKELGLDLARVRKAWKDGTHRAAIDADQDLAEELSAGGTPTFFINGRNLVGAQPFEKFQALIDEEAVRAERLVAKGIPRTALYQEIIKDGKKPGEAALETKDVAIPATSPVRGAANAPVVIQEFSDFQCPFCSRASTTVEELLKLRAGKVKVVWRNLPLPFHADAQLAAEAALEAKRQRGNDGFWKMHDAIFAHQQQGLGRTELEKLAREQKLDETAFARALDQRTHKAVVDADAAEAQKHSINSTPTFLVGRYVLSGAQPVAKFRKLIDRVLKEGPGKPAPRGGK